ncbi:MAG TPA: DUF4390 domain-containing protein [Kofleriaceae bacterium]|nr:DUF4390 domain-containing protein [Kofleriaceae bacterium]
MRPALALAGAAAAAVLAIAPAARAEDDKPEIQRMRFVESGDELRLSTLPPGGIGKLFDTSAYEALSSGIPSTVVIRIQIAPQDSDTPVAEQLIQRSVVYDVWDEIYTLRLDQPGGRKTIKVKFRAEALKWLTSIEDLPVARLTALPIGQVFVLKMVVELNPVSRETLAEVRRWLSQGNGGGLDRGGAFFGSFVSVFYNPKIADADRVLRIRSQPFFRPPP